MQVFKKNKTTILHGVILMIVMSMLVGCSSPGITSTQENGNNVVITKDGDTQKSLATDVIQAESFNLNSGVTVQTWGVPTGQAFIGDCIMGDYVMYNAVDFGASIPHGQPSMQFIASIANGCTTGCDGKIEIWIDNRYGTRVGTLKIPYQGTGAWNTFKEVKTFIPNITGIHHVYLVFTGYNVANVDWFKFASAGSMISDYSGIYVNAEATSYSSGIIVVNNNRIGYLDANDYFSYSTIPFASTVNKITFMIACPTEFASKYIRFSINNTTNSYSDKITVYATDPSSSAGWDNFNDQSLGGFSLPAGNYSAGFNCISNPSALRPDVGFGNIDWIKFNYSY